MKQVIRLVLLALVLMTVALISALTAMRFAIHGREVAVPKLIGLTPAEAERSAVAAGLQLVVERQYYSVDVPEGRIMSQLPAPDAKVRRGWRVRVAQSLGKQRVAIPDVVGQSERAAELNIRRRGLEIESVAHTDLPGASADRVAAQSPPPNAVGVATPRINLLVTNAPDAQAFVMPSFIGQPLGSVTLTLQDAGLRVGDVGVAIPATTPNSAALPTPIMTSPQATPASLIVSQSPAAGQRVRAGSTVGFEVQ
jgi:eukaryotic-like serine/threonine-protein kinase